VTTRPVRDFDFHPGEDAVRVFTSGPGGVPDLAGRIVETGDGQSGRFAFNCDIATPMPRPGAAVFAVDLFADVLVRADSFTYQVCDLEELDGHDAAA
jgi:hypothetical protein